MGDRLFMFRYYMVVLMFMMLPDVPVQSDEPPSSGPFTIDQLVDLAFQRHPELASLEIDVMAAKAGRIQAGKWLNPELSGELGQKTVGESDDRGWVYGVELLQTFEYPGKAEMRKAIADKFVEISEAKRVLFLHVLEADIRGAAGAYVEMEHLNRIVQSELADMETALAEFLRRKPPGIPQTLDKVLIEAALVELRAQALDVANEVEETRAEVNLLLGRQSDSPLEIVSMEMMITGTVQAVSSNAQHPAMTVYAIEREQAALERQASRISTRPDLEIGPYYSDESVGEDEYTIGLMFAVPLPWWDRSQGDIRQAQAREEQAMVAQLRAERELMAERDRRMRDLRHQQARLEQFSPERMASLHDAARLAYQPFLTGAITSSQYIDLQQTYLSALHQHYETRADLRRSAALLHALIPTGEYP
jgi:cobalt-zinc-cadmium efflux system outer membrane protein